MDELKFNLYENAIDSIVHAMEHYTNEQDPPSKRYKYAILHFSQGLGLLLKERLRIEHPNFIYKDVSKPNAATVDLNTTLNRLKQVAGIELDEEYETSIRHLADIRNKIEHFEVDIKEQEISARIGKLVPFLITFIRDELKKEFNFDSSHTETLLSVQRYHEEAVKAAVSFLIKSNERSYYCNKCHDNTAKCEIRFRTWRYDEIGLSLYRIQCLACFDVVADGVLCQKCKSYISLSVGQIANHHSYCESCKNTIYNRFDTLSYNRALFASEVETWLQSHQSVTFGEMMDMAFNVSTAGSSRPSFAAELYRKSYIDFFETSRKNEYLTSTQAGLNNNMGYGFAPEDKFKWVWADTNSA